MFAKNFPFKDSDPGDLDQGDSDQGDLDLGDLGPGDLGPGDSDRGVPHPVGSQLVLSHDLPGGLRMTPFQRFTLATFIRAVPAGVLRFVAEGHFVVEDSAVALQVS